MIWKDRFGGLPPSEKELERDIAEELELHLEMRAKDFERDGLDRRSAQSRARSRFGNVDRFRGEMMRIKNGHVQRVERTRYWDELRQDIGFGLRQLARKPALPLMIVALLAIGVGVNTAIFSVVNAVLLEPLPYRSPERLVIVWDETSKGYAIPVSHLNFIDWRTESRSFEDLGAFTHVDFNLTGRGEPQQLAGSLVSAGLFELLGVQPLIGRTLLPEEDEPGAPRVVLVSHGLWQRRFGGDPGLIGQLVTIDGEPFTVIGVMPPDFELPTRWNRGNKSDLWVSHHVPSVRTPWMSRRSAHWLYVVGRLKDGVSTDEADQEMDVITKQLEQRYPEANKSLGAARVTPLNEELVRRYSSQLLMLLGAAGLVLLIVCGNVSGLLMAKATTRQTEIAVRSALGAGRWRLIRQQVAENIPVSMLGGVLGLVIAIGGIGLLRTILPTNIHRIETVIIDGVVFGFLLALTFLTGILFSLAPAWATSKTDLTESLNQGRGYSRGHARSFARNALVVTQFALTLVLANASFLMLQSYLELRDQELGFSTENVLNLGLSVKGPEYENYENLVAYYQQVLERVETVPGVSHVAVTNKLPLEGGFSSRFKETDDHNFSEDLGPLVEMSIVTRDYFRTMGIPLLEGRDFAERRRAKGPTEAVINKALAEKLWPDESPIGKRVRFDSPSWWTITGVVGDARQYGPQWEPECEIFLPLSSLPEDREAYAMKVKFLVAKTEGDAMSAVAAIRQEVAQVDPNQPISRVRTMEGVLSSSLSRRRFHTLLIGIFATIALILVAAGIYGVMSFFVAQRTHEIGIRVAMGAGWAGVQKLVLRQGLKLAAVGVAVGLVGVFATTKLTASMIYGVSPTDPATLAGGMAFLVGLGLLGSLIPALRASRVDPILALRDE
jgi:putative ABC transport system permease protein